MSGGSDSVQTAVASQTSPGIGAYTGVRHPENHPEHEPARKDADPAGQTNTAMEVSIADRGCIGKNRGIVHTDTIASLRNLDVVRAFSLGPTVYRQQEQSDRGKRPEAPDAPRSRCAFFPAPALCTGDAFRPEPQGML